MTDGYGRFNEWFSNRLVPLATLAGRFLYDVEITGQAHIPTGPVIFCGNHLSHVDPPLMSLAARTNVRYLAVADLYGRVPAFDRLILFFGAIPTPRHRPPLGALRTALRHLEEGGPIGVFPEGRRVEYWGEEAPRRGAAWLALRTGAPIVPVAIAGAQGTLSCWEPRFVRTPVRIWVEPPLDPGAYLDRVDPLAAMMEDWRRAMHARLSGWVPESARA